MSNKEKLSGIKYRQKLRVRKKTLVLDIVLEMGSSVTESGPGVNKDLISAARTKDRQAGSNYIQKRLPSTGPFASYLPSHPTGKVATTASFFPFIPVVIIGISRPTCLACQKKNESYRPIEKINQIKLHNFSTHHFYMISISSLIFYIQKDQPYVCQLICYQRSGV